MPALSGARRGPKRCCTQSRSRKRALKNARVAPTDEANDTISRPVAKPKMAPPAKVRMAAPGSDSAVTAT